MMKLIVALRNFANASKNENDVLKIRRIEGKILLSHIPGIDFLNLFFFYVLLTVHLSVILVINELNGQIFVLQ